jgi:hypothetical protein
MELLLAFILGLLIGACSGFDLAAKISKWIEKNNDEHITNKR